VSALLALECGACASNALTDRVDHHTHGSCVNRASVLPFSTLYYGSGGWGAETSPMFTHRR
jgi:hypothetical protein